MGIGCGLFLEELINNKEIKHVSYYFTNIMFYKLYDVQCISLGEQL